MAALATRMAAPVARCGSRVRSAGADARPVDDDARERRGARPCPGSDPAGRADGGGVAGALACGDRASGSNGFRARHADGCGMRGNRIDTQLRGSRKDMATMTRPQIVTFTALAALVSGALLS